MANKKLIYADDLMMSIIDDPEINAKHFARFKEHIEHAPAVEAEPKRGRWIEDETHTSKNSIKLICTSCLHWEIRRKINYLQHGRNCGWRYCPNCGAKMMEVDNE